MTTRAALPETAEKMVRDLRRATHRQYAADEKIGIVLGLRGDLGPVAKGTQEAHRSPCCSANVFIR